MSFARAGFTPDPASAVAGAIFDQQRNDHRLRQFIATVPDAEDFAFSLQERELIGLRGAWCGRTGWRVSVAYAADLAALGLVEAKGVHLTAFGMSVRRVLMDGDA